MFFDPRSLLAAFLAVADQYAGEVRKVAGDLPRLAPALYAAVKR
jgi:hypothetical protein